MQISWFERSLTETFQFCCRMRWFLLSQTKLPLLSPQLLREAIRRRQVRWVGMEKFPCQVPGGWGQLKSLNHPLHSTKGTRGFLWVGNPTRKGVLLQHPLELDQNRLFKALSLGPPGWAAAPRWSTHCRTALLCTSDTILSLGCKCSKPWS